MASISPNSDVIICKGVPLDIGYEHTIYQVSRNDQYNLFYGYRKFVLNEYTYQRLNENYIRVGIEADKLHDCNYMMFRNTSYLNTDNTAKWFYAFITEVNYINDVTSEIRYEIDVMQTYYFDYDLGNCFVEREHSLTDYMYESLTDEGLDPGDIIVRNVETKYFDPVDTSTAAYYAVIYYIPNDKYFQPKVYDHGTTLEPADMSSLALFNCYNFVPMPTFTLAVPIECGSDSVSIFTVSALRNAVRDIVRVIGATIVTIQMMPAEIAAAFNLLTGTNNDNNFKMAGYYDTVAITEGSSFDDVHDNLTYTPKNKKLYQYPYNYVTLSNNSGENTDYKWELFDHNFNTRPTANFRLTGAVNPDIQVHCYPLDYRNAGGANSRELGLTIQDFPRVAWSVDSFQEWWNVNKNTFALSMISKVLGTAAAGVSAAATGNPLLGSAAVSGVGAIAQSLAQISDQKATPDTQRGSTSGSGILLRERRMGFTIYDMCITGERAKIIDDYFSMYGYSVKRLKEINVRSAGSTALRPYWNYIKTSNVVVHGFNMNADAERQIEDIYNKGITFWMQAANVGNYSLNNAPRI